MQVFKKDPMQIIYDYVKELKNEIPIYKWIMNEDENSIPSSYILLRSDISNSTALYGDAKSLIRQSDCDITLVSKGAVTSSRNTHIKNIKKLRDLLESKDIHYSCFDLGYDDNLKSSQFTFSTTVYYIG